MSQAAYVAAVRAVILGVGTGALSPAQGVAHLVEAATTYLTAAWEAGARRCGILPAELTVTERAEQASFIATQLAFAPRLVNDVYARRDAVPDGDATALLYRADLWGQRYHHAQQRAELLACADKKALWVLGTGKDHCADCTRAAGRVHRRSVWQRYGWEPGSPALACGGWRCACQLVDTDAHALPGHPPYLGGRR